jgi:hypothetical protein
MYAYFELKGTALGCMTKSGLQFHTYEYKYHYQMHINFLRKLEECS